MAETDRHGIPLDDAKQAKQQMQTAWDEATYTLFDTFDGIVRSLDLTDKQMLALVQENHGTDVADEYLDWLTDG